ncbi:MAG: TrkH family potassium uptake protein [Cellulomonadaceae bacterium]|nr:TrkH family potassium uptake protein [Cellulomonadaceae bacterium]
MRDVVDHSARSSPARLAVTVFLGVCAIFTALLLAPWATHSGRPAPFIDALFTAISAVCVTGLTVVPTGSFWSPWGLAVIIIAIKIGGLGIMTVASILGMAVSRRIGLTQRLLTASEKGVDKLGEVGALVRIVIITSTSLEVLIMLMLFPRFLTLHESWQEAAWRSVFYGISAFNNAGFVPTPAGNAPYAQDWMVLLPIAVGVFIGALGFPVILNILAVSKRRKHIKHMNRGRGRSVPMWRFWSVHTKLTLVTSAVLVVLGVVAYALMEWNNPETFGPMSTGAKLLNSLFASVMTRSGGFSTVEVGHMHEATWLATDALMFVGGGSASTGGGIKVTTLAVMILAIVAEARGDHDIECFRRRIPAGTTRLAIAVITVSTTLVLAATLALLELTRFPLDRVIFEVLSAFGTCGLSTGITPYLPTGAKYVLCALMFVGRTGTITLAAALALRDRRRVIRYPEERPILG